MKPSQARSCTEKPHLIVLAPSCRSPLGAGLQDFMAQMDSVSASLRSSAAGSTEQGDAAAEQGDAAAEQQVGADLPADDSSVQPAPVGSPASRRRVPRTPKLSRGKAAPLSQQSRQRAPRWPRQQTSARTGAEGSTLQQAAQLLCKAAAGAPVLFAWLAAMAAAAAAKQRRLPLLWTLLLPAAAQVAHRCAQQAALQRRPAELCSLLMLRNSAMWAAALLACQLLLRLPPLHWRDAALAGLSSVALPAARVCAEGLQLWGSSLQYIGLASGVALACRLYRAALQAPVSMLRDIFLPGVFLAAQMDIVPARPASVSVPHLRVITSGVSGFCFVWLMLVPLLWRCLHTTGFD